MTFGGGGGVLLSNVACMNVIVLNVCIGSGFVPITIYRETYGLILFPVHNYHSAIKASSTIPVDISITHLAKRYYPIYATSKLRNTNLKYSKSFWSRLRAHFFFFGADRIN